MLRDKIATVLQAALDGYNITVGADGNIEIIISYATYEQHLGQLYQQALGLIEQHFPDRDEDIRLLFRTGNGNQQHLFRIWHSAQHH